MSFQHLGLSEPLLSAIADSGYTQSTPIQQQAIPVVLEGRDVLAGAQTGTGKTAGFALPILERLLKHPHRGPELKKAERLAPRVIILTPTRELAAQVAQSVKTYGKHTKFSTIAIFGGVGMQPQINAFQRGVDIVVATPGRLLDLANQKAFVWSQVETFVLDEADRMLDMGFIHDIKKVMAFLPAQVRGVRRQNLLFSATYSDEIKALAESLLHDPVGIEVARRNTAAETVAQVIYPVGRERKSELLAHLINERQWFQVLVFTRTKHSANTVAEYLVDNNIKAMAIHGNKSQANRTKALGDFKQNKLQVLVATDIAARGIDIDQLEHVVNYDLPNVPEDYVHRIGRTGRAGATGEAVSLYTIDEENFLRDIERLIKQEIRRETITGFELNPDDKPQAIKMGRTQLIGAKVEKTAKPSGGRRNFGGNAPRSKPAPKPNTPKAVFESAPASKPKPKTGFGGAPKSGNPPQARHGQQQQRTHAHGRGTGLSKAR